MDSLDKKIVRLAKKRPVDTHTVQKKFELTVLCARHRLLSLHKAGWLAVKPAIRERGPGSRRIYYAVEET